MKIIDEKGRLFGKINVIDFLAILFLFLLAPMFYYGYRFFNVSSPEVKKTENIITSVDVYATFKNLSHEVTKLISVGDKELDSNGNVIGEILEISKVEPNFIDIKLSEMDIITKEDTLRKQVTLKIRFLGNLQGNNIIHKGKDIKIGSEIIFQTAKYIIKGFIIPEPTKTTISYKTDKSGYITITLDILLRNLSPEVTNSISIGDFEVDREGNTIAKILNVGSIEPYAYKINLGDGNYITKTDPQKKQVQVKMEIRGGVEGNTFYFRERRIALDSEIEFNTNKYNVGGVVIREPTPIKEIEKKWLLLTVKSTSLIPELLKVIKEGDMEKDIVSGGSLARVESIISIVPSQISIQVKDEKNLSIGEDPLNKDITLLIRALCVKDERNLLFKDVRVKINNNILFQTDKYDLVGKIIDIKEVDNY